MTLHTERLCDAGPAHVMRRNISQFGSDVITLVELQAELLQVDVRDWAKGFVKSVVALVAALVILLASLPVLLISLGYFIREMSDWPLSASMLIAAGVGILLAAILGGVGAWMLKRDHGMLHNFTTELKKNIAWLKQVISNPSDADTAAAGYAHGSAVR
ncbi:MAG TPA: phage holin family protein [Lacipirellula sp.]